MQIGFRNLRGQAETCPIAGDSAVGGRRGRHDVAAVIQPLESFVDLVGRKFPLQFGDQPAQAFPGLSDRLGERDIEFAVQEEFSVLRIEAHDIGREHVDGEIRRELHNVFAGVARGAGLAMACHEFRTRTLLILADRQCEAYSGTIRHKWPGRPCRTRP